MLSVDKVSARMLAGSRSGLVRACALALAGFAVMGCEGEEPKSVDTGLDARVNSPVDTADVPPDAVYDLDHDGSPSNEDCDDNDGAIFPGNEELCDGLDNDCDGDVDEGWDGDGDGHFPPECDGGDDCDDANGSINPSADDVPYDGVDQDCSGADNLDADGDGFDGLEVGGNDCDDGDASIYPGAPEVAKDEIDQNCDGEDLLDGDGDGYDDEGWGGTDCDDADADIHPNAWDWMNDSIDADCDGSPGRAVEMNSADIVFSGTASSNDYLAYSITSCDIDADGQVDLIMSAPLADGALGQVGIFLGTSNADWGSGSSMADADILITGDEVGFGLGVDCGDLDGDGLADLVAASGEYYGYGNDVRLSVFYGGRTWAAEMMQSDADADLSIDLGTTSSTSSIYGIPFALGDLDGDGAQDLMINTDMTPSLEGLGDPDESLWLIPGGSWVGEYTATDLVTARITPDQNDILSSYSVVPDWDGDGKNELVIGQAEYSSASTGTEYTLGRLSFISGWPAADDAVYNLAFASLEGSNGNDYGFGYGPIMSDFDGDEATDLYACAPYVLYAGRPNAGACYVFSDTAVDITATGLQAGTYADSSVLSGYENGLFGAFASKVSDFDGDGIDDVIVTELAGGTGGNGRTMLIPGGQLMTGGFADDIAMAEWSHINSYSMVSSTRAFGDFDGDGHTDYVFGAMGYGLNSSGGGYYQGRAWVWLSSRFLN
jgi:hypothetical protein